MRKEIIFAILAGTLFGVVLAFGFWRANSAFEAKPSSTDTKTHNTKQEDNKAETVVAVEGASIALTNPKGNVATSEVEMFSGLTIPNSWMAISSEEDDYVFPINSTGEFNQEVSIIGGMNNVLLSSFGENEKAEMIMEVLYSSRFIDQVYGEESSTENSEDEDDSSEIDQAVQEKIKAASDVPVAYLGSVTDIADTTIQIKSLEGEIQQISIADDTTYVSIATKAKEIKNEDLAIGDFIAAIGFKNGQKVLSARRILVFADHSSPSRIIVNGTVDELNNSTLTVTSKYSNKSYTVDPDAGYLVWEYVDGEREKSRYANLKNGDEIIVIGDLNEDDPSTIDARTIYITKASNLETEED